MPRIVFLIAAFYAILYPLSGAASGRPLPVVIDMGPGTYLPGSLVCLSQSLDSSFAWTAGQVRDIHRRGSQDPLLSDGVESEDAVFLVAVDPPGAAYRLRLTLGDPYLPRGPVTIRVNGVVVADSMVTEAGATTEVACEARARDGLIAVRLSAGCRGFLLAALALEGPDGAVLARLLPTFPSRTAAVPPAESLTVIDAQAREALLRRSADFLLEHRPKTGGFSYHGAWYQNAYSIRTLIAASRILTDTAYATTALETLDWFAALQRPDGNWNSSYYGSQKCAGHGPDYNPPSANLADIGTMTGCLAVVAPFVDGDRRDLYLTAAITYAEKVSLPNQLPSGAFPNRQWDGRDTFHPYTVATATQVASLSALHDATGDSRFLEAAERGARWLARLSFLPDGRLSLHPHDRDTVLVRKATSFGDAFYVAEALISAHHTTCDTELRAEIELALDRWMFGDLGLQSEAQHGYWWPPDEPWSDSKMGGMIYVLARHPRRNTDPALSEWLGRALAWMSDPGACRLIGVMAHPADTLGGYALPATGFAGVGIAAAIDPDVLTQRGKPEVRSGGDRD
jgi:hypothetical protein